MAREDFQLTSDTLTEVYKPISADVTVTNIRLARPNGDGSGNVIVDVALRKTNGDDYHLGTYGCGQGRPGVEVLCGGLTLARNESIQMKGDTNDQVDVLIEYS